MHELHFLLRNYLVRRTRKEEDFGHYMRKNRDHHPVIYDDVK